MLNASQKMKTTPAGDIPVDWECVKLGKAVDILTGFPFSSKTYSSTGHLLCRGDNVGVGRFRWDNAKSCNEVTEQTVQKYSIEISDILLAMDRTWITEGIKMAVATEGDAGSLLVQRVARLRCSEPDLSKFISAHFNTRRFEYYIKGSQQEGGGVPHISKAQISSYSVPLPPLPEQQKIAEILGTWDRAIETQQQLIDSLTRRKKALIQQLLTGKTRLPGFEDEWEEVKLSDIFERVKETAGDETPRVLSITAGTGFVDQREKFSRVIAGKNIAKYIQLRRGDFSYNKGNSKRYPMGCVYQLHEYDDGVVPNVFYSFRSKGTVDNAYYKFLFKSGYLNHQLSRWINSGVRNDGLLNLNAKDFFKSAVPHPPILEQQAISTILSSAGKEIELHTDHLDSLRRQKRGLMQQLLTGKTRVTI